MIDKIDQYEKLKFSWDNSIKELGNMNPSNGGHTSIFMYPYNYKFKKNSKIAIESLKNNGWIYQKDNTSDFRKVSKLTNYVRESLFNKKNFSYKTKY